MIVMAVHGQSEFDETQLPSETSAELRMNYKYTSGKVVIESLNETQHDDVYLPFMYKHRCNLNKLRIACTTSNVDDLELELTDEKKELVLRRKCTLIIMSLDGKEDKVVSSSSLFLRHRTHIVLWEPIKESQSTTRHRDRCY